MSTTAPTSSAKFSTTQQPDIEPNPEALMDAEHGTFQDVDGQKSEQQQTVPVPLQANGSTDARAGVQPTASILHPPNAPSPPGVDMNQINAAVNAAIARLNNKGTF